jgi:glycosyltransferase involved in cell wall biosynthesis
LAPEKEIPSLLAAYANVVRQMPNAHLFLVGDGPDHAALQARSRELGLERNVHFSGRCPPDGVRAWLKASDVFALVSSNEGFSCSLAEAMSSALPSVVSDIPANTQLIGDQVHGLIAPLGDDAALAGALLRLLGDAGLRQRLGAAARRRVIDNYSIDMDPDS